MCSKKPGRLGGNRARSEVFKILGSRESALVPARKLEDRNQTINFTISRKVKAAADPDGIVFLHIGRGRVFTANGIGARIWQSVADRESFETLVTRISGEYGVAPDLVERDAAEFLAELESQGLLTRGAGC
jgi:hypothetical protein